MSRWQRWLSRAWGSGARHGRTRSGNGVGGGSADAQGGDGHPHPVAGSRSSTRGEEAPHLDALLGLQKGGTNINNHKLNSSTSVYVCFLLLRNKEIKQAALPCCLAMGMAVVYFM